MPTDCPLARALEAIDPAEREAVEAVIEARVAARAAVLNADAARHLHLAQKGGRIGTFDIDMTNGAAIGSGAWAELLGEPPGVTRMSRRDWLARIHPEDRDRMIAALGRIVTEGHDLSIDYRIVLPDRSVRWIFSRNLIERDAAGQPTRAYGTCQDITDRKLAEEAAWQAAHFDALTGLPNRRLFQTRLQAALDQRSLDGQPLGLALIDLDHLKRANDCFGHDAGDALLGVTGSRLATLVDRNGTVARLGGDEFAVLWPGADADTLRDAMERAIAALCSPFVFEGTMLSCGASAGGAITPAGACEAGRLFKHADLALAVAKAGGKGRYVDFDPAMQRSHERQMRHGTEPLRDCRR